MDTALQQLSQEGKFSGAVVIRDNRGVRFARGYGAADPFTGALFKPETPVDSASLAKPVTAAALLILVHDGKVELDAPVRRYLPEYPHAATTIRHLLAHSAGLALEESPEALAGKTNADLLAQVRRPPLFPPGSAFAYCNLCYITLAILIERVSGLNYLQFVHRRASLPAGVTLRPRGLAQWTGRAIGHRRSDRELERFDSWEGEALYGSGNFSISAAQLAQWGTRWWHPGSADIRQHAVMPALIAGKPSGLSLGNWYCSDDRQRCHYLGHHEGFHHMLYWDARRRISVAMVTNNGLAPQLHQRLQRALVAFAERDIVAGRREIAKPFATLEAPAGEFRGPGGDAIVVKKSGDRVSVEKQGLTYPAYPTGSPIRYVPGLDAYIAGDRSGRLHWITLYDEFVSPPRAAS